MVKIFGDFKFDDSSMKLTRADQRVRLTGQALGLLVLLMERPGELITREEIQRSLWPNRHVEFEHSMDVVLNRLRKALGDDGRDSRYVQTVSRRGYRFIGEIRPEITDEQERRTGERMRMLKTCAAVAFLAAAAVFFIARTRYEKVVRPRLPAQAIQTK